MNLYFADIAEISNGCEGHIRQGEGNILTFAGQSPVPFGTPEYLWLRRIRWRRPIPEKPWFTGWVSAPGPVT